MKKTLAIVLALVMVLCMIPAMSADTTTTKTVSDKNYTLVVKSVGDAKKADGTVYYNTPATADKANSITYSYNFEEEQADITGKWTEDTKMAYVTIKGLDKDLVNDVTVTIDGKKLESSIPGVGFSAGEVSFPIELTKAGYSDTYLVQITGKNAKNDVVITETAKVSVKLVNSAAYKDAKTATITDIESTDKNVAEIYIVGSKIYIDYVAKTKSLAKANVTFADENGKAFSVITYAYDPTTKTEGYKKAEITKVSTSKPGEVKLVKSAAEFHFAAAAEGETIKFELETQANLYETKAYEIVMRTGIVEADPKGIYFAEPTKTIAMGEEYTPVVMGVATGKKVDATIDVTKAVDKQVLDNVDYNTIIGTREGVAYITASYKPAGAKTPYTASSMKIVVTLPGESIPPVEPAATIYYVTCRNLNVRKGAGTSYAKAGMIHRGDAVEVVEIKGGWAKLANGNYVCAKYIAK